MTSEYKTDNESSSTISTSSSDFTDSSDNEAFDIINALIAKKKNKQKNKKKNMKKNKKINKKRHQYHAPIYQPPPYHSPYYPPYHVNPHQEQIEDLHQTLLQQIEYNKKRKLKKKKKKLIKKQENTAAIKIQKWWKQYRVISKWQDPLLNENIQKLLLNNDLANKYLDELIEEYFLSEFVPDLLIEILSNENDDEFYQKDVLTQITWSFYEEIEQEICEQICVEICNHTINEIVSLYFDTNRNTLNLKSILHHIQNEIINEVIVEETKCIVDESIEELIMKYLIECKSIELYNDLLPDIIEKNVNITLTEYILEKDVVNDFLLDSFLNEWILNIANEEYEIYKKQISQQKKAKEFDLIESCLIKYLLNEELLNILINKLSTRSEISFINNQSVNLFIHSEMSKILIKKHMNLYKVYGRTKQNIILNESLMKLLSDTAIHHFINFLKHQ